MLEENKKSAIAFYNMACEGKPREVVARFVGDRYIQYNSAVENEKDGTLPVKVTINDFHT